MSLDVAVEERSGWRRGEGPRSKRRWGYQERGEGTEQIGEERKKDVTKGGGEAAVFFSSYLS